MRAISMWLMFPILLVFQLSAYTTLTGETAGRNIDDATITTAVKSKLPLEKASSFTRLT